MTLTTIDRKQSVRPIFLQPRLILKNSFRLSFLSGLFLLFTISAFSQTGLVISQVYGGGGNSGAQYTNDFIELSIPLRRPSPPPDSPSSTPARQAPVGTPSLYPPVPSLRDTSISSRPPQAAARRRAPTPDATIPSGRSFNLSATTGKVALVNSTTALTGACPLPNTNVLDFIGYGTANCFEGAVAPAPSNTLADVRANPSIDTNNNSADFPPRRPIPATLPPADQAALSLPPVLLIPPSVIAGQDHRATVTVTPPLLPQAPTSP